MSDRYWYVLGFTGQAIFFGRWVVQWIASERAGRAYIPMVYWWSSIVGAAIVLVYSVYRRDPVFIFGMAVGLVIYVRNLMLALGERARTSQGKPPGDAS